ncbi:MAG TPA: hypothetical protein VG407_05425 [Caulobacteraceae bacterium]|jgi:hypothetical protein|nr:hypothetical protein [Caulobacteraceae bacterium]
MVRVLLLALAASALALALPEAAAARPHKPAPAAASHKKAAAKTTAKGHAKGRAEPAARTSKHGRAHADEETASDEGCAPAKPARGRHPRKTSHACASEGSARGRGAREERATSEDCDEAPARDAHGRGRHAKPARKSRHACSRAEEDSGGHGGRDHGGRGGKVEEEDCVEVTVKGARGRHGRHKTTLKCTRRMVPARLVNEPPPGPPPPPPMVVAAPGSPADIVKHSPPGAGINAASNPDVWAQRDQAGHRPRLPASPHLTGAGLIGRSDEDIRRTLGVPDLARGEGDGALWTYRLPACSLMVFLKRTDGAMKVSGAQAAPLQRGGAPVGVDACLAASAGR